MWDSKRDTDVNNRLLDSMGEGEGGMIWENSIETCILSYVKQIDSPGLMHEVGCSGLVHWDDPEGRDWERGGMECQDGEHMYTHGWFMWMYGKNHHNIIISLQLKQITQKNNNFMTAVTICSDYGAQKNKVWHCFPIYFPWSDGTRCHDLHILNVEL